MAAQTLWAKSWRKLLLKIVMHHVGSCLVLLSLQSTGGYIRNHTGPTQQEPNVWRPISYPCPSPKKFARSVNATRPHSVKGPRGSSCVMRSREPPKPGTGHAFGPWRQWFLSMHTNQGHAPASCGNKHSPGRTYHESGDCTHSPLLP